MSATGTDVKPREGILFMRDVRSAQYFEQMKGRGTRTIDKAATFNLTEGETATRASRLSAREAQLAPEGRAELDGVAGQPLRSSVRTLVDAVDPDTQAKHVAVAGEIQERLDKAIEPIAANPELRTRIIELRRAHDRVIDEVSRDTRVDAYGVVDTDGTGLLPRRSRHPSPDAPRPLHPPGLPQLSSLQT